MRRILWTTMVLAAVASLLIGCEQRTDREPQPPSEQELPEQSPPPPPDQSAPEGDDAADAPTEPAPESPK